MSINKISKVIREELIFLCNEDLKEVSDINDYFKAIFEVIESHNLTPNIFAICGGKIRLGTNLNGFYKEGLSFKIFYKLVKKHTAAKFNHEVNQKVKMLHMELSKMGDICDIYILRDIVIANYIYRYYNGFKMEDRAKEDIVKFGYSVINFEEDYSNLLDSRYSIDMMIEKVLEANTLEELEQLNRYNLDVNIGVQIKASSYLKFKDKDKHIKKLETALKYNYINKYYFILYHDNGYLMHNNSILIRADYLKSHNNIEDYEIYIPNKY